MRSLIFNLAFGAISVFYGLWAALAALHPSAEPVRAVVRRYAHTMAWAMRAFAGIEIEARGRWRLPAGPYILAPKHASYGDGFSIYAQFEDLAFVTGDHLERFPLLKTVLRKFGAIVVRHCGGPETRGAFAESAASARAEGRKILIYPEGALAPVGVRYRYRSGVYHLARDLGLPVVPVASNLGLFWPQEDWGKRPGRAVIEFLPPLSPDLPKAEFMAALESAVEDRTSHLVAEATGRPATAAVPGAPETGSPRRPTRRPSAAEPKPASEAGPRRGRDRRAGPASGFGL